MAAKRPGKSVEPRPSPMPEVSQEDLVARISGFRSEWFAVGAAVAELHARRISWKSIEELTRVPRGTCRTWMNRWVREQERLRKQFPTD